MKTSKIAALLIIILSLVTTQADAVFSPVENYDMSNTQVAYISYIDETGSNIGTDKTNPAAIISNYQIQSSMIGEEVDIEGTIQDIDFNVQGNILTTNENRNVIIFDAKDNNNNYDVAYCSSCPAVRLSVRDSLSQSYRGRCRFSAQCHPVSHSP